MPNLSQFAWLIAGTVTDPITGLPVVVNMKFDVPGDTSWPRPEPDAQELQDPCSGVYTQVYRLNGVLPKRTCRPTFRIPNTPDRATMRSTLENVYRLRGPWQITCPSEGTVTVMVAPTVGNWTPVHRGISLDVQFGFREV